MLIGIEGLEIENQSVLLSIKTSLIFLNVLFLLITLSKEGVNLLRSVHLRL